MIQQRPIEIGFSKGLDTKTDSKQIQVGNFLSLKNAIFTTTGLLKKRNGFPKISSLPDTSSVYLTTFNKNLTAVGSSLSAYVDGNSQWVNKGSIQPINLSTLPIVRSNVSQVQCDSVIAANGIACVVYTENNNGTLSYKYSVYDSVTSQKIVNNTAIPIASGAITGSPRVFLLGGYFMIVFTNTISATKHLQYVSVSVSNPSTVSANTDLAVSYAPNDALSWDAVVVGNNLYFSYYTTSGGSAVKINYIQSSLIIGSPVSYSNTATIVSVCADVTAPSNPVIYASFYDSGSSTGYVVAVNSSLQKLMTATQIISSGTVYSITSSAQGGVVNVFYESSYNYVYDTALVSHYIQRSSVTLPATLTTGTVTGPTVVSRSVGLASKSFIINGTIYLLAEYASSLQSTYFLMDSSGNIYSRFAYENGGASLVTTNGYLPYGLPQAQVVGTTVSIPYLYKDLIESQSTAGLVASIGPAGGSNIYSQTGVNVVSLNFTSSTLTSAEVGLNLNLTGGMLWAYDGSSVVEQGFNVFPDNVEGTIGTGGSMAAQQYYYQVTYEYTDAQGNIIRSAPSIPITVTTAGSGSVTLDIPTLRLSYKTGVKIQIYRWSANQEVYYQVTSITAPTLNDPTVDYITYVDLKSDAQILGNNIIYTTGGVVENIPGPSCSAVTVFDNRLWLVDAEDRNLLWYSKQIIGGSTPVEMSDLFTYYITPTIGAQGSTGPITALAPLDSNLIIFKRDAIYYLTGNGPDSTGASNQFTQPIFITSTVGCINQNSIVITNNGLMFQSDKGIWLLGHQLSVEYIGAPVEGFNASLVNSSQIIPATTQARFTLSTGEILMYDYFQQQWGEFSGISSISSTLYQGKHTLLTAQGLVLQETPDTYLDNGNPVLISFETGYIQLAGLSGYQRIYEIQLLGQYFSPHFLNVKLGYNYGALSEYALIHPNNYADIYGNDDVYGQSSPFGGMGTLEQWRIQPETQKCQTFQMSLEEVFDPAFSTVAGAGFTLSAMTCTIGVNRSYRPVRAADSVGTQ